VNQVDLAALVLVALFAYKGYRTGLVSVVLGLTGGLLAFGLAAVLAPVLAPSVSPFVTDRLGVPEFLVRPALLIALTFGLRFLLGFAVRELASVVGLFIRTVPPLALADRLLGILPSAALGAILAVLLVTVALKVPTAIPGRDSVQDSWIATNVVERPERTFERLRDLGDRLVAHPPRLNGYLLGAGVTGLVIAAIAAGRLRAPARSAAFREAPTRRMPRRMTAEAELPGPFAWVRLTFGVGVALAMAAGLVFLGGMR
jgi:uncharacterized membrane protein required for colicin V production